jgi:putative oxidoreductase
MSGMYASHLVPLLLRAGVGLTFVLSGLEKVLGGVENVADYFASLGIPWPGVLGPVISYLELGGGLALLLGLLTRVLGVLFACEMFVAIVVARLPAAAAAASVTEAFTSVRLELMLLLAALCLALLGSGRLSLDAVLVARRRPGAPGAGAEGTGPDVAGGATAGNG